MKKIFITKALLFLLYSAFAQTHNEQVTVVAPYQPTVLDAYKINVNPQTIDSSLTPREARYDILSRKVMTSFGIDNIKPARVSGEPISKLSPLYIRGGFGNYKTTYGELFYGSERSAQWQYGAHLKHFASQGTFKNHDIPFDRSDNTIELSAKRYEKRILFGLDFYYDRKARSLYAPDSSYSLDKEHSKYIYNDVGGRLYISDNNTNPNALGYDGIFDMNIFQSNTELKEISLAFDGNIHQTFDFNHPFFNQTVVGMDVSADWHSIVDSRYSMTFDNPKMFKFHPYGKMRFSGHDFALGLRMNIFDEPETGSAVQFVPTIRAKFNLIDNVFGIEFGMDGNAEYSTYKRASGQNPFLLENPFLLGYSGVEENYPYQAELHREYYLGLNTALSKTLDFSLKGRVVSYKNLLNFDAYNLPIGYGIWLFVPTPFFESTYQDINCFQLQTDLNYHLNEKISVSAMGRLNSYDGDILYKPKYEAHLQARYNLQDKIILKTQFYFASEIYYNRLRVQQSIIEPTALAFEKFNPTLDWSLSAEYRFNKHWSAFFEWNNILNRMHYDWYNYRTFRANVLIGAAFKL